MRSSSRSLAAETAARCDDAGTFKLVRCAPEYVTRFSLKQHRQYIGTGLISVSVGDVS